MAKPNRSKAVYSNSILENRFLIVVHEVVSKKILDKIKQACFWLPVAGNYIVVKETYAHSLLLQEVKNLLFDVA